MGGDMRDGGGGLRGAAGRLGGRASRVGSAPSGTSDSHDDSVDSAAGRGGMAGRHGILSGTPSNAPAPHVGPAGGAPDLRDAPSGAPGPRDAPSGVTDLLEHLARQGVDPALLAAARAFARAHPVSSELAGRVPCQQVHYQGRDVWEQALAALLAGENLLLRGPKATGKNLLAHDLAAALGRPTWDVSLHVDADASALIGQDTYADGRVSFRPGPIHRCATAGGVGVLDEVNMARSEALAVLHATLDFRRVIDVPGYDLVRLDPATRFVATMNAGYAGTRSLNEALVSRFVVIEMPEPGHDEVACLLRATFPDLRPDAAGQFATLFCEIRLKAEHGEITDAAVDLRGIVSALRLMRTGLDAGRALRMGVVNKVADPFERQLVADVVRARVPKACARDRVFS